MPRGDLFAAIGSFVGRASGVQGGQPAGDPEIGLGVVVLLARDGLWPPASHKLDWRPRELAPSRRVEPKKFPPQSAPGPLVAGAAVSTVTTVGGCRGAAADDIFAALSCAAQKSSAAVAAPFASPMGRCLPPPVGLLAACWWRTRWPSRRRLRLARATSSARRRNS